MKNRVLKEKPPKEIKTISDLAFAFMGRIRPQVQGIKVSVIINEDLNFVLEYAETNLVRDALLGMEVRHDGKPLEEPDELPEFRPENDKN